MAATRKEIKYAGIVGRHMFEPIAVETLGVFNASAIRLLNDLGSSVRTIPPVATIPDTDTDTARRDARRHHTTMRQSYDVTTFHHVARVLCDYDVSHVFL